MTMHYSNSDLRYLESKAVQRLVESAQRERQKIVEEASRRRYAATLSKKPKPASKPTA